MKMPKEIIVLYYNAIKIVLDRVGHYMCHYWLMDDLKNGDPPSEASYKTLVNHHEGSRIVLQHKLDKARTARSEAAKDLTTIMNQYKIYNEQDAVIWCRLVSKRREDCDFREKMRDWCNSELKKIEKSDEAEFEPITFAGFIDRWNKLVTAREKRRRQNYL